MKLTLNTLIIVLLNIFLPNATAHEFNNRPQLSESSASPQSSHLKSEATYLGNEGVMISNGHSKILFDPFFHNDYKIYQLVPESIRSAIFKGEAPYNNIDAIFISHAHEDHFSAEDALKFLQTHKGALLIAPQQAIDMLMLLPNGKQVASRTRAIALKFGDQPVTLNINDIMVEAVRIPHAGWPGRANISNLVFRVTLNDSITIMHMGDADPNDSHYSPFQAHWEKRVSDVAFPPYWFFLSASGNTILQSRLNALKHIGVHVPVATPAPLTASGADFFSTPGETRSLVRQ